MSKRIMIGKVVTKIDKTLNVQVTKYKKVPIYGKSTVYSEKYLVHNPNNLHNIGDVIEIIESRPFSKRKHFEVLVK